MYAITTVSLNEGERLVGVKSCGDGKQMAWHLNLQWIIASDFSKLLILKLFVHRETIHPQKNFSKIPYGVMREVIKFVRY